MQRPIKFRAWNNYHKEMHSHEDLTAKLETRVKREIAPKHFVTENTCLLVSILNSEELQKRYNLMQFIGLYDKNGKEIYEGDIFEKKAHPHIYERTVGKNGCYNRETYTVHPGVLIRYAAIWDDKECDFDAKIIYVNPTGVLVGSTNVPRHEIAVGDRHPISLCFNENRKLEIIGNIYENPELVHLDKKKNTKNPKKIRPKKIRMKH